MLLGAALLLATACARQPRPNEYEVADPPRSLLRGQPAASIISGLRFGDPAQFHILSRAAGQPQFLMERNLTGAGKLSSADLQAISQKSCAVLNSLGPQIQWVHSYVTDDQTHCVYRAPNAEMVREHARQGGFPTDRVSEIRTMIDPTTAE